MNTLETPRTGKGDSPESAEETTAVWPNRAARYGIFLGALTLLFAVPLFSLFRRAAASELNSYILLTPFISGYLIWTHPKFRREKFAPAIAVAAGFGLLGAITLLLAWNRQRIGWPANENDRLSLLAIAFVSWVIAGGAYVMGGRWMRALAFPFGFLYFLAPLPVAVVNFLEQASQAGSADAAELYFTLAGTPFLRDAMLFQLPDITIRVAQECSGIHSSLVLFIASLLCTHVFLRTPWRRGVLLLLVVPLGILRNGFRIFVLGWLCIHVGPEMIDSPIHHRGGPVFFALSLIPLFLLLWWLRKSELRQAADRDSSV